MSRRKGGFFGWLRKLFARSKSPEMTTHYNPAPVQQQYHHHQQQHQPFQQYQQQQQPYNKEYGNGQAYHPPSGYRQDESAFHHQQQHQQRADEIAQIQVAGMRRTAGSGYVPAYANRTAGPDPDAALSRLYDQTTVSSYGTNGKAWGEDKYEKQPQADSTWRGKPVGKQYDRREELTEEDEDMWARMAM